MGRFAAEAVGALIPGDLAFEDVLKKFFANGGSAAMPSGGSSLPALRATALVEEEGMRTQRHGRPRARD